MKTQSGPLRGITSARILLAFLALLLTLMTGAVLVQAQDTGQFCVRAYEDVNSNQRRDAGESLLPYNVAATLRDASGVIIASAMLDTSPLNDAGWFCFQGLAAGQYAVAVTSAEYLATGLDNMTMQISASRPIAYFDYGGRSINAPITAAAASSQDDKNRDQIVRLVVAAGGALFTMMVVASIGIIIYVVFLRRPSSRVRASYPPYPPPGDTSLYQRFMPPDPQTDVPQSGHQEPYYEEPYDPNA